jgi:hypothetical protein
MAVDVDEADVAVVAPHEDDALPLPDVSEVDLTQLRNELLSIRRLLDG